MFVYRTHVAEQIIWAYHLKERLIKWVRYGISCFYIAIIKYHDQNQLTEELILAYSCRELDVDGEDILTGFKRLEEQKTESFVFMLSSLSCQQFYSVTVY